MRVKIHPSFFLYLISIAILSSYTDCIAMLIALLIHEIGHCIAALIAGESFAQLELTPFGGVMQYKQGTVSSKGVKGVFVHAAGPLGNYAMLLISGWPVAQQILSSDLLRSIIIANTSMLLLNLLPALPLDGGQIVFCLGYYLFPTARLAGILSALGGATGGFGLLLCLYGLFAFQTINCSLLIVSVYLAVIARQSYKTLLTENIYAVIQERLDNVTSIRRIEHYRTEPNTALYELIPYLKPDICVTVSFLEGYQTRELTESAFCQGLLSMPSATIKETWTQQYQEKKPDKA